MKGSDATFCSCRFAPSSNGTPMVHALIGTPDSDCRTSYVRGALSAIGRRSIAAHVVRRRPLEPSASGCDARRPADRRHFTMTLTLQLGPQSTTLDARNPRIMIGRDPQ